MEGGRVIHWEKAAGMDHFWVRRSWAAPLGTGFCCRPIQDASPQGKTLLQIPLHPSGDHLHGNGATLIDGRDARDRRGVLEAAKTGQPGKPTPDCVLATQPWHHCSFCPHAGGGSPLNR